jgi:hypothetical protein
LNLIKGENRDGWAARILFSYPEKYKAHSSDYSVPEEQMQEYMKKMEELSCSPKTTFVLSPDAKNAFFLYDNELKKQVYEEGNPWIADALGKMTGYLARLTLVLHCLKNSTATIVDASCVDDAWTLLTYFIQNMKKVYAETDMEEEDKELLAVINYLQRKGKKIYSIRELYVNHIPGCKNSKTTKEKIRSMAEKGIVRWLIKDKEFEFLDTTLTK